MSFRQDYAATAARNIENLNPMTAPLEKALRSLPADIERLRKAATNAQAQKSKLQNLVDSLFSRNTPRSLRGQYDSTKNTLTYNVMSVQREQTHRSDSSCYGEVVATVRQSMGAHIYGDAYVSQQASVQTDQMYSRVVTAASEKTAQAVLSASRGQAVGLQAYGGLHDYCASADIDCRIELESESLSWQRTGNTACTVATIALKVVVYLDQPYAASSDRPRLEAVKAATAAPALSV